MRSQRYGPAFWREVRCDLCIQSNLATDATTQSPCPPWPPWWTSCSNEVFKFKSACDRPRPSVRLTSRRCNGKAEFVSDEILSFLCSFPVVDAREILFASRSRIFRAHGNVTSRSPIGRGSEAGVDHGAHGEIVRSQRYGPAFLREVRCDPCIGHQTQSNLATGATLHLRGGLPARTKCSSSSPLATDHGHRFGLLHVAARAVKCC